MKKRTMRPLAAGIALALTLSLLTGCGGDTAEASDSPPSSSEQTQQAVSSQGAEASAQPSQAEPSAALETEPVAEPMDTPTPEPASEPPAEPTVEPAPESEPSQSVPEDGIYTARVTLSGGTGRASVQSPATLRCVSGQFTATIVWSSSNYDYMKVNGVRYDPINAAGENSAFEIPVAAFDQALAVIGDTVAMSEPHEVEYTLTFDSASLTKQ